MSAAQLLDRPAGARVGRIGQGGPLVGQAARPGSAVPWSVAPKRASSTPSVSTMEGDQLPASRASGRRRNVRPLPQPGRGVHRQGAAARPAEALPARAEAGPAWRTTPDPSSGRDAHGSGSPRRPRPGSTCRWSWAKVPGPASSRIDVSAARTRYPLPAPPGPGQLPSHPSTVSVRAGQSRCQVPASVSASVPVLDRLRVRVRRNLEGRRHVGVRLHLNDVAARDRRSSPWSARSPFPRRRSRRVTATARRVRQGAPSARRSRHDRASPRSGGPTPGGSAAASSARSCSVTCIP